MSLNPAKSSIARVPGLRRLGALSGGRRGFVGAASLWLAKWAVVALFVFAGCGPIGPFPGGALRGEVISADVADWSFADDLKNAQLETRPEDERVHRALGLSYAGLGEEEAALRHGARALEIRPPDRDALMRPFNLGGMAYIHAQLGHAGQAVEYLEELWAGPNFLTVWDIQEDLFLDPIRDDPRFVDFLRRQESEAGP